MRALPLVVLALLGASAAHAQTSNKLVVSASAPLDAQRLADALRSQLDGFGVEVVIAPAPLAGDLREELRATRAAGDHVRAIAAVRVAADAATVAIELVDRVSGKTLLSELPRVARAEDLYRSLALKVQALLRSALYEQVGEPTAPPIVARLVTAPPAVAAPAPPPSHPRLALEAAYVLAAFPVGGLVEQGIAVAARLEPWRWLELRLGVDALFPIDRALAGPGNVLHVDDVPLLAAAAVRGRGRHVEGSAGAIFQLDIRSVDGCRPGGGCRERFVDPALGGELAGRLRLGRVAWLFARAGALGVLRGERFLVGGQVVANFSGVDVRAELGLGAALW